MGEKRFSLEYYDNMPYVKDNSNDDEYYLYWAVELMNELVKEKDDWKNNCLKSVSENSILWNEIFILMEQGAEPSDAFKNYLNDLKNKNNKLQGDFE